MNKILLFLAALLLVSTTSFAERRLPRPQKQSVEAEGASLDNPRDLTSKIVNYSFEDGDLNGWTTQFSADTGVKESSNGTYYCDNADGNYLFNTWSVGYPITQKIVNLPNGVYNVGAMLSSDCTNVYMLAHGFHKAISLEENPNDGRKNTWFTQGNMIVRITDGTLEIGAVGSDQDGVSYSESGKWWYKADHFTLIYYGNKFDAFKYWIENGDDLGFNIYDEEVKMTGALRTDYNEALNKIYASTTVEEGEANLAALKALSAEIDENVAAWAALEAVGEEAKKIAGNEELSCDEQGVLANYLKGDFAGIIAALKLSTEKVNEEIAKIEQMIEAVRINGIKPGTDVTELFLKNADFAAGGAGWTYSGGGNDGDGAVFDSAAKCAEAWNSANFDIYQEVKGLPEGYYSIQVQGFYRRGRDKAAWQFVFDEWGQRKETLPEIPTYVYLNDSKTPLMYIFDYQVPVSDNYYSKYYTDPIGAFVYPDDISGAGAAFDHEAYIIKAGGIVKKGEPMRIGVKGNTTQENDSWAVFTRFKLVYEGKYNVAVLKPALEDAIAALEKDAIKAMGTDVKAEALVVLAEAQAALSDTSGEAMYNALETIYAVQTKIEASVALYAQLGDNIQDLDDAIGKSKASNEVKEEAESLLSNLNNVFGDMTDEEMTQAIKDIDAMIKKLAVPANIDEATESNPVELDMFITNSSFEDGDLNGWTVNEKATGDTGVKENTGVYTLTNADGMYVLNTWNPSSIEGGFFLNQTMDGLPRVGNYIVKALVASDKNNVITLSANQTESEITIEGNSGTAEEIECKFKVENINDEVVISISSDTWFKADKFQLFYLGGVASTAIDIVKGNASVVKKDIITIAGAATNSLKQGVNIIRITKADGSIDVKKVIVK